MTPLVRLSSFIAVTAVAGAALAQPANAPHAAACVAALEVREGTLAAAFKAGAPVETELLKVTRSGIAHIGMQYLAGLREAEARELLKSAQQDFRALPPGAADARQASCLAEGEAMFTRASAFERGLMTTAAQHRVRRLTAG